MLAAYLEPLDRLKLDGYVYPAIQMPPPDETMPQDGRVSEGPHSATSWVNMIGVPAVVVPAGFYASGLPFGLEFSARPWTDGDLLAIAYAWEQATHLRKPPTLVERGLLAVTPARESARVGRTKVRPYVHHRTRRRQFREDPSTRQFREDPTSSVPSRRTSL